MPISGRANCFLPEELLWEERTGRVSHFAVATDLVVVAKNLVIDVRIEFVHLTLDRRLRVLVQREARLDQPFRFGQLHHVEIARTLRNRFFAIGTIAFVARRIFPLQTSNSNSVLAKKLVTKIFDVFKNVRRVVVRRGEQRTRDGRAFVRFQIDVPKERRFRFLRRVLDRTVNVERLITWKVRSIGREG